jgi:microcystin-dependent protein
LWQALGSPNTGNGFDTFNLPDLRGEFIRGWDHGRGIDISRAILSNQTAELGAHTHQYNDTYYSEHWGSGEGPQVGSGRTDYDNYDYNKTRTTASSGGTETRPRNVALMPIIKW